MRRSFLALQGPASPFFRRLASKLCERGHALERVNFCGGDLIYGGQEATHNFCGRAADLPLFFERLIARSSATDVLMFGDCRAVHWPMHGLAERLGLRVHVFEEGYVRPHWITLERYGVNGRSLLPRDPEWYRAIRSHTPPSPEGVATGYNLFERAHHDIRYRMANGLLALRFPHYKSHRPRNGIVEYVGLGSRQLRQRSYHLDAARKTHDLLSQRARFYLFPLQLNSDSQILVHSSFANVAQVIDSVIGSFAAHAPGDTLLVIKNHPLDSGLVNHRRHVERVAAKKGVSGRVYFLDAGHLPTLLDLALGAVVVNSTVGLSALHHGKPLIALGEAVYSMPGLTWQHGLDAFWHHAEPPDMSLYSVFLDYVMHRTQINGDFYTQSGIEMAADAAVARLEGDEA